MAALAAAAERETAAPWETVEPNAAAPATTDRCLIATADAAFAGELAQAVCRAGVSADVATDGLDVLFHVERDVPDVIVLDLDLAAVSGFRVLQLLRRDPSTRDLPVIVVSWLSFQEAKEAVRLGLAAFLTQPVDPEQVAAFVRRLLVQHGHRSR